MFLNSSALKTNIKLKHILFQNRMDSIQNNLKPEVKEETEEEKSFSVSPGNFLTLKILLNYYQEFIKANGGWPIRLFQILK
jgi:hypothetical protein